MYKISVVIPTYNRAHTLRRAIDSVLQQTFPAFEIIVVDDASTDETAQVLSSYGNKIKIIWLKKNSGVSAARNHGIKEAGGEWISFLDSDDSWLPQKLEKQINLLARESVPLVHGEEIWVRKGVRVNAKKKHKKYGGNIFVKCLPLCLISPSAAIIKKDILLALGGFDESFVVCEDYDLWLKLTSQYAVGFVADPIIVKYGGHDDQLSMKYKGMDYWRIKALEGILKQRDFSPRVRALVVQEMMKKARILAQGCAKHGDPRLWYATKIIDNYGEVQ